MTDHLGEIHAHITEEFNVLCAQVCREVQSINGYFDEIENRRPSQLEAYRLENLKLSSFNVSSR